MGTAVRIWHGEAWQPVRHSCEPIQFYLPMSSASQFEGVMPNLMSSFEHICDEASTRPAALQGEEMPLEELLDQSINLLMASTETTAFS